MSNIVDFKFKASPTVGRFMRSDAFHRAIIGPIGSGKSVGCAVEILRRAVAVPKWLHKKGEKELIRSSRWAVTRNTNKQLQDTTIKTWLQWMHRLGEWQDSKKIFWIRFGDVEAEIIFLPLDREEDVGRVLSMELTGAWINEFRHVPVPLQADIKGRLRRYPNPEEVPNTWYGLIADSNPPAEDTAAWRLMEHLPQEEDDPNSIIEVDTFKQPSGVSPDAENLDHLHPDYYKDLIKGNTKVWIDTYVHGEYPPSLYGKPVYGKTFIKSAHVSKSPLPIDPFLPVIVGFDTGLKPAAVFYQLTYDGRLFALREAVGMDMGMKRFAKIKLRPIIRNHFHYNPIIFVGDPAGVRRADSDESSAFGALREEFDDIDAVVIGASTNNTTPRIESLSGAMIEFPSMVPKFQVDRACKWLIAGLSGKYRYRKIKATGDYQPDPEKNDWSHVVEGAQYGALFALSGAYNPDDYSRSISTNNSSYYRGPAQKEGY